MGNPDITPQSSTFEKCKYDVCALAKICMASVYLSNMHDALKAREKDVFIRAQKIIKEAKADGCPTDLTFPSSYP